MSRLGPDEQRDLLRLARASIERSVGGGPGLDEILAQMKLTPEMELPRGAFVSLKLPSKIAGGPRTLRGCIGTMNAVAPLYRTVIEFAAKAAVADPRFQPLTAAELPGLYVEVSALTPMTPVGGPDEVRPGIDGVQLTKGGSRAVFLPQVAGERGWGVEEMLSQLALKAGLPRDGWIGAQLSVFHAEVFGEVVGES